ncbi:hypothetical protein ACFV4T_05500 [Streptomyces sp. NPDC059755]|uniref:hypothetical protein n=1 Tax=Streptomyces sp. NPDC059755 TaxID=3346934 RepID=UPI00365E71E3
MPRGWTWPPQIGPNVVAAATVTARGQRGDGSPPSPSVARIHVTYDGPATTGSRLMPGARE